MCIKNVFTVSIMFFTSLLWAAEKAPQEIVDIANNDLLELGRDKIIIEAVRAQNSSGLSMESIQKKDSDWKKTAGVVAYMQELIDSKCGQHLRSLQKNKSYLSEIFVMDNQGANVAMSDKTSDYWQGDEEKFIECYKGGAGVLYISDVEFDESTQVYSVEVSVPVKDGDKTIGAICFEVDVDAVTK